MTRRIHSVHRWRIAARELDAPKRILLCCAYRRCDATRVYDLRKVQADARKVSRAFFRIFGDELTGQMETGL